jgi:hypothetical protein
VTHKTPKLLRYSAPPAIPGGVAKMFLQVALQKRACRTVLDAEIAGQSLNA